MTKNVELVQKLIKFSIAKQFVVDLLFSLGFSIFIRQLCHFVKKAVNKVEVYKDFVTWHFLRRANVNWEQYTVASRRTSLIETSIIRISNNWLLVEDRVSREMISDKSIAASFTTTAFCWLVITCFRYVCCEIIHRSQKIH